MEFSAPLSQRQTTTDKSSNWIGLFMLQYMNNLEVSVAMYKKSYFLLLVCSCGLDNSLGSWCPWVSSSLQGLWQFHVNTCYHDHQQQGEDLFNQVQLNTLAKSDTLQICMYFPGQTKSPVRTNLEGIENKISLHTWKEEPITMGEQPRYLPPFHYVYHFIIICKMKERCWK